VTDPRVEVATKALLKEWRRVEYTDLWLQFTPRPAREAEAQVSEAVEAANDACDDVTGEDDLCFGEGPSLVPIGWSVEPLGHGRHLVQAHDLAAWFAQPEPAPDVLAKARADFGPLILTRADIDQKRPPGREGGGR